MLLDVKSAGAVESGRMLIYRPGDQTAMTTASERSEDDLNDLIRAISEDRDRRAFTRLFQLMAPKVKGYCVKRGSSPSAAEETTQETMIQVWNKAGQFDPQRASAATWIYTIARNKRIDQFRREQHPTLTAEDIIHDTSEPIDAQTGMEQAETGETLADRIRDLSAEQAEVIRKAFFEDKTHQDIAKDLDLPLGTVKSRIRLALAKLRSSMPEYEQ
jgi:RNA polymerase sigma-70 factor (ECF subfamily)